MSGILKASFAALVLVSTYALTQAQGGGGGTPGSPSLICGGPGRTFPIPGAVATGVGSTIAEAQLNGQAQLILGFTDFGNSKCPDCPEGGPQDCGGGHIALQPPQSPSYGVPQYNPILQQWTVTVSIGPGGIFVRCNACP